MAHFVRSSTCMEQRTPFLLVLSEGVGAGSGEVLATLAGMCAAMKIPWEHRALRAQHDPIPLACARTLLLVPWRPVPSSRLVRFARLHLDELELTEAALLLLRSHHVAPAPGELQLDRWSRLLRQRCGWNPVWLVAHPAATATPVPSWRARWGKLLSPGPKPSSITIPNWQSPQDALAAFLLCFVACIGTAELAPRPLARSLAGNTGTSTGLSSAYRASSPR
ncbi:MAG: hypothetical protein ACO3JL_08270 [Myxococcota bacterium]